MSKSAEKPEIVQLPAETPIAVPAHNRRAAAQRVREARDRLTSTSGTRPAFDRELLRQYAQTRLSASYVVMLLVVATGLLFGFWMQPISAAAWTGAMLCIHAVMIRNCRRFLAEAAVADRNAQMADAFYRARSTVRAVLDRDPDPSGQSGHDIEHADDVPDAAGDRGVEHAGGEPADRGPGRHRAGHRGDRAQPRADTAPSTITCSRCSRIAAEGYFALLARRLHSTTLDTLEARAEKDALIGELEQAKAISDEARHRAESANVAKSRFLAQMSHELRTPLNAILGFSEVMKSEIFGGHAVPVYKEYSADIHNSGVHLLNLINEILDLSRIEAGRYELNEEAVSLVHVVADCHHLLKLRASSRGITIHEVFEHGMPRIWGDERATRQIVLNLLSNSIKFTPQGGEIWLKVGWTASGGQYLSVKDTGSGIAEDEIPIVLASFGQGSNSIKSAEQGAGLGLPIAKSLIDMHGGTFTLKSKLRIGTEVIVTFPPERVMSALAPMIEETAPPLQPEPTVPEEKRRARNKPIMSAGTGL